MTTTNRGPNRRTMLVLTAAMALGLAGCETLDPKVVQGRLAGKSVAVASALGPDVRLVWIGTTVFNNEYGDLPAADWGLDAHAAQTVADAMKATGRYGAVTIAAGATRTKAGALVLPPGTAADYVVVLEPESVGDPLYGTNQNLSGLGMAQRTFAGQSGRSTAYAAVRVSLRDAAGKELGGKLGLASTPLKFLMTSGGSSGAAPVVAASDQPALREALREQLTRALQQALSGAGLN